MNVALWAEIRRLAEIEKLSGRAIARRLHCSRHTVAAALEVGAAARAPSRAPRQPAWIRTRPRSTPCWPSIPNSRRCASARRSLAAPMAIPAAPCIVRRYLRTVRPARGRVYQEVHYEPAQAMQVDWGECGRVQVGATTRKVSVFVAVLCYSRLIYIEFTLSQRKAEFYRGLVNALDFFGGSPRAIIFDNLKAAVLNGSGRAACFHPEFLALCGYFCLQPIACERRDPESKGIVEGGVRYVKHNALAGRGRRTGPLRGLPGLGAHVARPGGQRADARDDPRAAGRPLPAGAVAAARRCRRSPSTPTRSCRPSSVRMRGSSSTAIATRCRRSWCAGRSRIRANRDEVRVLHEGQVVAQHVRCYERGQLIVLPDHRLAALALRRRSRSTALEQAFDALGPEARQFHLQPEEPAGEDRRPPASLAGSGASSTGRPRCWPPSPGPWSWRPTTPPMSRTCCWRNAGAGNFPRPRCPLPSGAN